MTLKQKLIACATAIAALEIMYQQTRININLRKENKTLKRQNDLIGPQLEEFFEMRDRYITDQKFQSIINNNDL